MRTRSQPAAVDPRRLEEATRRRAGELLEAVRAHRASLASRNHWTEQVLRWCLADADVRARILRFIDCLPALATAADVVRHVHEFFPTDDVRLPRPLRLGASLAGRGLTGPRPAAWAIRRMTEEVARQFIAGHHPADARAAVDRLARRGFTTSVDLLGEEVLDEPAADAYADRYVALLGRLEGVAAPQVSVKPSALAPGFAPPGAADGVARALPRLERIAAAARRAGAGITLDMEMFALRDMTLDLAWRLLERADGAGAAPACGVVLQAYLRDTEDAARRLAARLAAAGRTMTIRLVKGAYWDAEVAVAAQASRPAPVWTDPAETDAAFERLTDRLLDAGAVVGLAVASHNLRSIAHAMAAAEARDLPADAVEFQVLYGMGESIAAAVRERGYPVRVYVPAGEPIAGMGYLVRRLLENTANDSLLRPDALEAVTADAAGRPRPPRRRAGAPGRAAGTPLAEFADRTRRDDLARALDRARAATGRQLPLLTGGREIGTARWEASVNPAAPGEVVARSALADVRDVERAVEAAVDAAVGWRAAGAAGRGALLVRAADLLEARRDAFAALEILEVGKTWREADADVTEAVDYLRYYAAQAAALERGEPLPCLPGEANRWRWEPRGPAAVIAPWNFPLAIPAGMTAAALATGNPVLLKPSRLAPAVAHDFVRLLHAAGVPPGAVQFVPGTGEEAGDALARHPDVPLVLFTGSRAAGLKLLRQAADHVPGQWELKRALVEMGGKNAIVVDDDADLDAATAGILASAFGYGGQKCSACSRVVALAAVAEPLARRLGAAIDALRIRDPADPAADLGPLIDAAAVTRLAEAADHARAAGRIVHEYPARRLPPGGWYAPPHLVAGLPPEDPVARAELFGPLVCLFTARTFAEAVDLAMDSDYALTGGVYSRSPARLAEAEERFRVGNLYFNRPITGAVVGRQPFGGWRTSGLGTKAGGPDSLRALVWPRTVTENTARHGMPLEAAP